MFGVEIFVMDEARAHVGHAAAFGFYLACSGRAKDGGKDENAERSDEYGEK